MDSDLDSHKVIQIHTKSSHNSRLHRLHFVVVAWLVRVDAAISESELVPM
jgi:hypothetical protein